MESHDLRIARTESLFRNVNERIAESVQRVDSDKAEFVCECSDSACTERIETPVEEYERVRSEPTYFLLRPGHEDTRVERVVRRRPRYAVVEKVRDAIAGHVRRLDPRARTA
jgi:hypothetical protein